MPGVVKRSTSQAVKPGRSRRDVPLPQFVAPQLSQPVAKPPSGPQWVHEIKLDGYRMAARIDNGRAQLLTRTGLDWTNKYPGAVGPTEYEGRVKQAAWARLCLTRGSYAGECFDAPRRASEFRRVRWGRLERLQHDAVCRSTGGCVRRRRDHGRYAVVDESDRGLGATIATRRTGPGPRVGGRQWQPRPSRPVGTRSVARFPTEPSTSSGVDPFGSAINASCANCGFEFGGSVGHCSPPAQARDQSPMIQRYSRCGIRPIPTSGPRSTTTYSFVCGHPGADLGVPNRR
jgi:hypothetical protein